MTDTPAFHVGDRIGTLRVLEVVRLPGIPERCYRCEFEAEPGSRPGLVWERQLLEIAASEGGDRD